MARVEFRKILRIRSIFSLWQASRRPHFCESSSRRPPTSKHSYYRDANRRTTLPSNPPSFRALRPLRSISLLVRDAEGCDGWDVTRDHQNRILGRWRIGHGHGHGHGGDVWLRSIQRDKPCSRSALFQVTPPLGVLLGLRSK